MYGVSHCGLEGDDVVTGLPLSQIVDRVVWFAIARLSYFSDFFNFNIFTI